MPCTPLRQSLHQLVERLVESLESLVLKLPRHIILARFQLARLHLFVTAGRLFENATPMSHDGPGGSALRYPVRFFFDQHDGTGHLAYHILIFAAK